MCKDKCRDFNLQTERRFLQSHREKYKMRFQIINDIPTDFICGGYGEEVYRNVVAETEMRSVEIRLRCRMDLPGNLMRM